MANEKRLIDARYLTSQMYLICEACQTENIFIDAIIDEIDNAPTVDAVVLPYKPRPMLKDRNPHNTDVYCPECGTNLSGYYGDEPLPIVTCFNCGEILDPHKATTGTDGERKYNGE